MALTTISIDIENIVHGDRSIEVKFDTPSSYDSTTFAKKLKLALQAVEIDPVSVAKEMLDDGSAQS